MVNMNVGWAGPNPSLATLARELNARFGNPARAYEYVTGYKSPSNITSHNADANGRGHGMDIFVGVGHNISVEQGIDLAERLRLEGKKGSAPGHPDRLAYIIHRGRIAGDHTGWEWVAYTGAADHYDHIHISSVFDYYWGDVVAGNPADYNSTAAWNFWAGNLPLQGQAGDITIIDTEDEELMGAREDILGRLDQIVEFEAKRSAEIVGWQDAHFTLLRNQAEGNRNMLAGFVRDIVNNGQQLTVEQVNAKLAELESNSGKVKLVKGTEGADVFAWDGGSGYRKIELPEFRALAAEGAVLTTIPQEKLDAATKESK